MRKTMRFGSDDFLSMIERIRAACSSLNILFEDEHIDNMDYINNVVATIQKKGVAPNWILFNTGLFWEEDNQINNN